MAHACIGWWPRRTQVIDEVDEEKCLYMAHAWVGGGTGVT